MRRRTQDLPEQRTSVLLTGVGNVFAVRHYKIGGGSIRQKKKCRNPRKSVSLSRALYHKGVSTYRTEALVKSGAQEDGTEGSCVFTSTLVAGHKMQPAKKNPPDARLWVGYKVSTLSGEDQFQPTELFV